MSHISDLFDRVNGGDDVDAAAEAQEIAEGLLAALQYLREKYKGFLRREGYDDLDMAEKEVLDAAIRKAGGKGSG